MTISCIAKTLLLEFKIPAVHQSGVVDNFVTSAFGTYLLEGVQTLFRGSTLTSKYSDTTSKKVSSLCFGNENDVLCTIRIYKEIQAYLLVTATIEYDDAAIVVEGFDDKVDHFRCEVLQMFNVGTPDIAADQNTVIALPSIRHGEVEHSSYYTTSDGRLIEYGFTERVYNKRSQYQHIQIKDTVDYGRILFLDDAIQLAESDSVGYTQAFMNLPHESYAQKKVLILGSGDGSLIYEVMKCNPDMVTMIDLDEDVVIGCGAHMKKACGDYLQERKGNNYEVLVGDAIAYMKQQIDAGIKYDYVFTDLTDMPVGADDDNASQSLWQFLCLVANLAVQLVDTTQDGKLMVHCNRKTLPTFITKFEAMLRELKIEAQPALQPLINRKDSFVPSFVGTWVFYQVSMQ